MEFLLIFGILIVLIGLFVGSTYLNEKSEIPDDCKAAYLEAQSCETCSSHKEGSSCGFSKTLEFMKEVKL